MRRIFRSLGERIQSIIDRIFNRNNEKNEFPENLVWLHPDVSNWDKSANLNDVRVSGNTIHMPYSHARIWRGYDFGDMVLNANPWVIANINGTWYAATWEWLRFGQQSKSSSAVEGGHIKRREFNGWRPSSGEKLGFFISGLIRGNERNVSERTNIVWINWP